MEEHEAKKIEGGNRICFSHVISREEIFWINRRGNTERTIPAKDRQEK